MKGVQQKILILNVLKKFLETDVNYPPKAFHLLFQLSFHLI